MGVRLQRKKPKNLLLSIIYRLHKILPLSAKKKLKLYLDLEWIFDRLSHETSFHVFNEDSHPVRTHSIDYLKSRISSEHKVLDLGCKYGEISFALSHIAREVVGIDYSASSIQIAKKKHQNENLSFLEADAKEYLANTNEKFDVLILSHIIEHLDEVEKFLGDFIPYFKYVYVEVPDFNKTYLNEYRKLLDQKLIYSDTDHVSEFDRFELIEILENAGLQILDATFAFGIQKVWCANKSNS